MIAKNRERNYNPGVKIQGISETLSIFLNSICEIYKKLFPMSRASDILTYQNVYTIVPAEETVKSKPIILSEADIANIIRAKAAIYSA